MDSSSVIAVEPTPPPPLGTHRVGYDDLGPVSPELALVDDVLAERARLLLREPDEHLLHFGLLAAAQSPTLPPRRELAPLPPPATRPRPRRTRRTVLLAILVFAAGAASGGFLGGRRAASTQATIGVAAPGATNMTRTTSVGKPHPASVGQTSIAETPRAASPAAAAKSRAHRVLSRPNRVPRGDHRSQQTPAEQKRRRPVPATWVANVLGVTAVVDAGGVRLVWQRPAESDHVAVLRALPGRERPAVVFRGRAGAYRDASVRRCTVYRYSIVNYVDGHRSTGVPTSVVTTGCA